MNQEQLDVINTVHEVMRRLVLALGALNPEAMPRVAYALRAVAAEPRVSPMAARMCGDLAAGIELVAGPPVPPH